MENEPDPEVIRQQMQETRTHLAEKVEAVENLVTDTVKSTAEAVTETVQEVKGVVTGTVEGVKEVVSDTVEGVRSIFDVSGHFRRHPWLMLGGVTTLSFLTTKLVAGRPGRHAYRDTAAEAARHTTPGYGSYTSSGPYYASAAGSTGRTEGSQENGKSWLSGLLDMLGPSATKLKEMGIGYTMDLIDHMVKDAVPEQLRGGIHEVIQTLNTSLGGKPLDQWSSSASNGAGR